MSMRAAIRQREKTTATIGSSHHSSKFMRKLGAGGTEAGSAVVERIALESRPRCRRGSGRRAMRHRLDPCPVLAPQLVQLPLEPRYLEHAGQQTGCNAGGEHHQDHQDERRLEGDQVEEIELDNLRVL